MEEYKLSEAGRQATLEDILSQVWFAEPDTDIGGWKVSYGSAPWHTVAHFLSKELAEHVAELHNKWREANG